jgi:thioredoxin 1
MPANWTPADLKSHLDQGDAVFLKLWQKGCGPCRMSVPAVERLEAANRHGLVFGQICVDDHPEIAALADADVLPVFIVFKNKAMKGKFMGFKGIAKLESFLDESVIEA